MQALEERTQERAHELNQTKKSLEGRVTDLKGIIHYNLFYNPQTEEIRSQSKDTLVEEYLRKGYRTMSISLNEDQVKDSTVVNPYKLNDILGVLNRSNELYVISTKKTITEQKQRDMESLQVTEDRRYSIKTNTEQENVVGFKVTGNGITTKVWSLEGNTFTFLSTARRDGGMAPDNNVDVIFNLATIYPVSIITNDRILVERALHTHKSQTLL